MTVKTYNGKTGSCTVTVKQYVTKLALSPTSKTLTVGDTFTLGKTVTPDTENDKNVTWASGNTAVATVDGNGKVTGKKAGTAKITATAKDGGGVKGACTVTVEEKATDSLRTT
ncbi:MAG: Ig-like domain-containing protein [Oscillospiraceae bacterium]|nr:Ig-like domain-containing protein [Oscillospiraceae bacterium]